jgi:hypothetical protein
MRLSTDGVTAERAASSGGQDGFGTLGTWDPPFGQLARFASAQQFLAAPVQPPATNEISHRECIGTTAHAGGNDAHPQNVGINHAPV